MLFTENVADSIRLVRFIRHYRPRSPRPSSPESSASDIRRIGKLQVTITNSINKQKERIMKKILMIAAMIAAVMSVNAQEAGQTYLKVMFGGA